jgi:phage terminase small subunit
VQFLQAHKALAGASKKGWCYMKNDKLTQKQKRFCEQYLVDNNATQAAKRAGYSKKTASSIGSENRKKPKIQRYISQLKKARNLRTQVTADRVLQELAKIGFAKAEKGVKTGNKLKALGMLARHLGIFDNQFNFEKQARTKDVSEVDPIEHKNDSIDFYNKVIHSPNIPIKLQLTAQKQLEHLLGLAQLSIVDPEKIAAQIRDELKAMRESVPSCPENRANLTIC